LKINSLKRLCTIIFVLLCSYSVYASAIDRKSLYPFQKDATLFEVNRVIIKGNNSFKTSELFSIISTRESSLNFVHSLLNYYYDEGSKNSFTPKTILNSLDQALKPFQVEYKFINEERLKIDSSSIFNYYNKNGFHLVSVDYKVYGDTLKKQNVVEFEINEGERFKINDIVVLGIDSVDSKVKDYILNSVNRLQNQYYDENEVISKINSLHNKLLNNGYFFARKINENIIINKENLTDSITIAFNTGGRYRFGKVNFLDIVEKQKKVSDILKRKMITWKEGEYYSKLKFERTVRNLLALGAFSSVSIDTVSIVDSVINYVVITNYRNQREALVEPGFNQTQNFFYNLFIEGNLTHRNLFGATQTGNVKASILNRDMGAYLNTPRQGFFDYLANIIDEYYLGFSYFDPFAFRINDATFGIGVNPYYSRRRIENFFILNNFMFPISIPIRFKTNLDLSNLSINLNFERQQPEGFDEFVESGFEDEDFERVFQSLVLYSDLNNYFKNTNSWLSSFQINVRAVRDKRNNPFLPTKGHLISSDVDLAVAGLTRYIRLLGNAAKYISLSNQEVVAVKARVGGFLFFQEGNRYVPLDKQIFSGGANSVRGWASRRLRYTSNDISGLESNSRRLLENFVGNSLILETAIEYRYKFGKPEVNLGAISEHIESMGMTFFLDAGNSYGWLLGENDFNIGDIFTKIGFSGGTGLTYETPVGPVRLDVALPIYGPINYNYEAIWNTKSALSNLAWHIGLGYSF